MMQKLQRLAANLNPQKFTDWETPEQNAICYVTEGSTDTSATLTTTPPTPSQQLLARGLNTLPFLETSSWGSVH